MAGLFARHQPSTVESTVSEPQAAVCKAPRVPKCPWRHRQAAPAVQMPLGGRRLAKYVLPPIDRPCHGRWFIDRWRGRPWPGRIAIHRCRAHRFAPSEVTATRRAVLLAPVTARADEHLAPAPGTQKHPGIVHRSPRRGGLDDPQSPGNTALGAVRKCGSGRSLGRDRHVNSVRGCAGLPDPCDRTPTPPRRHRTGARRRHSGSTTSGSGGKHVLGGVAGTIQCVLGRPAQITSRPDLHHLSALFGSHERSFPPTAKRCVLDGGRTGERTVAVREAGHSTRSK